MRRIPLLLVAVALVAGCAWDGPRSDVRVVTSETVGTASASADPDAAPGVPTDAGPHGRPVLPVDPAPSGLEDRPAVLGAIHVPDTVAVVGDSLTVAATEEITTALAHLGVRAVVIDARESRRMASGSRDLPSGVSAIDDVLDEHEPDVWVVALGTNDVGAGAGPERFVEDLRTTVASIPATAPLVWVDVWIRDRVEEVVEANTLLRRELSRRPAVTEVVDWFSAAAADDDGVITGDGIHLTERGEERFAAAIADAVLVTGLASS